MVTRSATTGPRRPHWVVLIVLLHISVGYSGAGSTAQPPTRDNVRDRARVGAFDERESVVMDAPGCNQTALTQIPGAPDLFIVRQLQTADGQLPGASKPNDCSGGKMNRWGLMLDRFDWSTHKFAALKILLNTSVNPNTGHSEAVIGDRSMRGAIIRSAYDPSVVEYRGTYLVSYECTVENDKSYGLDGTSSCLSVYDPEKRMLDLARTRVVVTGAWEGGRFYAAAVPALLVFEGKLFIYWSAIAIENGRMVRIAVRGAELETGAQMPAVRGGGGRAVGSIDSRLTTEVWAPHPGDPVSDSAVDLRAVWVSGASVVAMAGLGGGSCTTPADKSPGCFRLAIVKSRQPLGEHIFDMAERVDEQTLPANPQEYTRPIRDPGGGYWFIGNFMRPGGDPVAESRAAPSREFWRATSRPATLTLFPLKDTRITPDARSR
jgi:hypothetical protein